MSAFSSARERRLWLWTLAVVASIYSTLWLTGTIAETVSNDVLSTILFAVGLVVAGVAVAALALDVRARGMEIGVALGVVGVYLMLLLRMTLEERTHLFEYGLVGALVYTALRERRESGRNVPLPALTAIGTTIIVGAVDEVIQAILPNRVFDVRDIGFNALAGLIAVASAVALHLTRSWRRRRE